MSGPLARILIRYVSAFLIAKGFFDGETVRLLSEDPELAAILEIAIGAALGAASEAFYFIAKKYGWRT